MRHKDEDKRNSPLRGQSFGAGRREFLKAAGRGLVGLGLLGSARPGRAEDGDPYDMAVNIKRDNALRGQSPESQWIQLGRSPRGQSSVVNPAIGLVKGGDRREIVYKSLKLIEDDVWAAIDRKKRVLIKPNMAVDKNPLAVTHVDAARAVLEFLKPRCRKPIAVAESGVLNTAAGFRNNGYAALEKEFGVPVVDLNAKPEFERSYVIDKDHVPRVIRVYAAFVDPDVCVISLARMKTHDTVLVTLSLKNLLMAAPVNDYAKSDKGLLHGVKSLDDVMHYNLFHLAEQGVWPDLAVIDGFESMEGHGPAWGTPLATRLALASADALAADVAGTTIMGFDPARILYLRAMTEAGMGQGDMAKARIVGARLDDCRFKFKIHKEMADIYQLTDRIGDVPRPEEGA